VSTVPDQHGILDRLQSKVHSDNVLQLVELPPTHAELIIKVLLDTAGRQVTLQQWQLIRDVFRRCTLPLFINLTFQASLDHRFQ
jgi:negative regulator of sigma E activity